jgi:hypothetical protein
MQAIESFSLAYARDLIAFYILMLSRAIQALLDALGTTILAIILAICIFVAPLAYKLFTAGLEAMKQHWKENIRFSVVITLCLWGGLYFLFFIRAIYEDHRVLSHSNISLRGELDTAKKEAQKALKPEAPPKQQTPVINIYNAPPDRRIPATRRDSIVRALARIKSKAYVAAPANDREAYQLAMEIFGILKDAGWNLPGGGVGSEIGQQDPGITIESYVGKGESVQEMGSVQDNAATVLMDTMNQINLHAIAVIGSTPGLVPGKFLRIIVGQRPPG